MFFRLPIHGIHIFGLNPLWVSRGRLSFNHSPYLVTPCPGCPLSHHSPYHLPYHFPSRPPLSYTHPIIILPPHIHSYHSCYKVVNLMFVHPYSLMTRLFISIHGVLNIQHQHHHHDHLHLTSLLLHFLLTLTLLYTLHTVGCHLGPIISQHQHLH